MLKKTAPGFTLAGPRLGTDKDFSQNAVTRRDGRVDQASLREVPRLHNSIRRNCVKGRDNLNFFVPLFGIRERLPDGLAGDCSPVFADGREGMAIPGFEPGT